MKLFMTGGTGFFGKAILRKLFLDDIGNNSNNISVVILSRNPDDFLKKNSEFQGLKQIKFYKGDVCDPKTFPIGDGFTHILHAATDSTLGPLLSPTTRFDQIINGTRNVLDFAVQCKAKRFLLTSSGGVYGRQSENGLAFSESWHGIPDPLDVNNAYSIGKRVAEHLCAIYSKESNLEIVIARCFAFVGRDLPLDVHFAIGNFIGDALYKSEIVVKGDGSPIRTYLDQRDLADWLIKILNDGKPGEAYNVGSAEQISIRELAYLIRDLTDPAKPVRIQLENQVSSVRNRYVPDISKARIELGLVPKFTLIESIQDVLSSHAK